MNTARILHPPTLHDPVIGTAVIKTQPEDFCVQEIPTYEPSGEGGHLFLWVEKRNLAAGNLLTHLSRTLHVRQRDIGVAGQKDKRAVTQQYVSVPHTCRCHLASVADGSLKILSAILHGNKLRTGHLTGNRFQITLRSADDEQFNEASAAAVRERLSELAECGFPNYFGPQRFGHHGRNVSNGIAQLKAAASGGGRRFTKKLLASSVQSAVFNSVLAQRVHDGTCGSFLDGDVVCRRTGIRPFLYADRDEDESHPLIAMGPLPGPRMMPAAGDAATMEREVMESLGISPDDFSANGKLTPGARRKLLEFPTNVDAQLNTDGSIVASFTLPPGSYATVLLAEICRPELFRGEFGES